MIEIRIENDNEMVRYEPVMNELRAIALWITENGPGLPRGMSASFSWEGDMFMLIKHYSRKFAEDIDRVGSVEPPSVELLKNAMFTLRRILGITDEDVAKAYEMQLYKGSGFWEMRRFLGQFNDIAEELSESPPDNIVTAGISGCVVGEYLALKLEKEKGLSIPVEHMVFAREGIMPSAGVLPVAFELKGPAILLVEDAVQEARTLSVMMDTLRAVRGDTSFSLFALEIEDNQAVNELLSGFSKVYTFEE